MSNRCVAAGSGNMPSDSVSLFRFPKAPNLDKLSERGWIGSLARRVNCFDEKAIYALLYNVTVS